MQRRLLTIKLRFQCFDTSRQTFAIASPGRRPFRGPVVQRLDLRPDRADDGLAIAGRIRDHDETVAEPFPFKTLSDDFDRSLLLANNEPHFPDLLRPPPY